MCVCPPFAVAKSLCATVSLSSFGASCTKCSTTTITAAEMRQACLQVLTLRDALSQSHYGSTRVVHMRCLCPCRSSVYLDVHPFRGVLGHGLVLKHAPHYLFLCASTGNVHHALSRLLVAKNDSAHSNPLQILPSADFIPVTHGDFFASLCAF